MPAELAEQEAALLAEARDDFANESLTIPRLSLVQGTTKNPPDGANPGDFYNTLTGAVFGSSLEFVVSKYNRGRFYAPDGVSGPTYVAGEDIVVPDYWPDELAGKVFSELPESEEGHKARANAGEIEWGSGPAIATTYNFTGYVTGEEIPARLSLMKTSASTARKIITLLKAMRAPWDKAIAISSRREVGDNGPYFVVEAAYGSPVDTDQRQKAVELFAAVRERGIDEQGSAAAADAADKPEAPAEPADGLAASI